MKVLEIIYDMKTITESVLYDSTELDHMLYVNNGDTL